MLSAMRRFVGEIRRKQAILKGKICPQCQSPDVVARGRPNKRKCQHCGYRWEHRGSSGLENNAGDGGIALGP